MNEQIIAFIMGFFQATNDSNVQRISSTFLKVGDFLQDKTERVFLPCFDKEFFFSLYSALM